MNTPFISLPGAAGSRRKSRRGMALILVLSALILTAGLVVSLLFLVKSGRIVSGAYAGQVQTRVLANTALNLVIGQIRDATSDTTMAYTWASQPGAIRVYSNGTITSTSAAPTTTDDFYEGYKLYSSSVMTATTEAALVGDVEGDGSMTDANGNTVATSVPTNWATEIGQYVNLNQPVTTTVNGTTSTIYPIVDPLNLPSTASSPNPVTSISGVQGFSDADPSNYYPSLAMPVEWLYQLQDGTFVPGLYLTSGTNKGATQVGGSITHGGVTTNYETPSPTNPIVARVAFWTDDETSKVNINTASEGLYWDQPRVNTQNSDSTVTLANNTGGVENVNLSSSNPVQYESPTAAVLTTPVGTNMDPSQNPSNEFTAVGTDQALASNQPAANEFNRFPGHPATTSLSAVFSELSPSQIFSLLPRYSLNGVTTTAPSPPTGGTTYPYSSPSLYTGGSVMGTVSWIYYSALNATAVAANVQNSGGYNGGYNAMVSLNPNHLYSSGAEVMLQSTRALNSTGGMGTPITSAMVQQRKFFLTAESRAPELNLFGCPRVSMWPVYGTYNPQTLPNPSAVSAVDGGTYPYCTAYDKMAAFCSTLQPSSASSGTVYPFYVKREDAYNIGGANPSTDMTLNTSLYKYLVQMTSQPVPGFGGKFNTTTKYGNNGEINQIITEALDYIRCTNLFDGMLEYDINGNPSKWMSSAAQNDAEDSAGNEFTEGVHSTINTLANTLGYPGYGQALPLLNGAYMGLGRTYTVSQVSLQLICTADYMEGGAGPASSWTPAYQSTHTASNIASGTGNNMTLDSGTPLTFTGGTATAPTSWQKRVQAILLVELATPMEGYPALCPSIAATIVGGPNANLGVFKFPSVAGGTITNPYNPWGQSMGELYTFDMFDNAALGKSGYNTEGALLWEGIGSCGYGGIFPFLGMAYNKKSVGSGQSFTEVTNTTNWVPPGGTSPAPTNYPLIPYALISQPFTVTVTPTAQYPGGSMSFTANNLNLPPLLAIKLYYAPDGNRVPVGAYTGQATGKPGILYQTVTVAFPSSAALPAIPLPTLNPNPYKWIFAQTGYNGYMPSSSKTPPSLPYNGRFYFLHCLGGSPNYDDQHDISSFVQPGDTVISEAIIDGDFRLNAGMNSVPAARFTLVGSPSNATSQTLAAATAIHPLQGSTQTLTTPYFTTKIFPPVGWAGTIFGGQSYKVDVSNPDMDLATSAAVRQNEGSYVNGVTMPAFCNPEFPSTYGAVTTGDWDNGLAATPDGPFANMADIGTSFTSYDVKQNQQNTSMPYFDAPFFETSGTQRSFSPNRIVPSPGMFGSLPTGVMESAGAVAKPWQTLRFRPQSNAGGPDYTPAYSVSIPDYLFMDLFWMPVVAPYAISEPFSTAGKINMNYQILPFTYIKRQTGLYAVLKHERMLAVPSTNAVAAEYKGDMTGATYTNASLANPGTRNGNPGFGYGAPTGGAVQSSDATAWRHQVNVPATLVQFDNVFNNNQIFVTPAQICDLYLVPQNGDAPNLSGISTAAAVQSAMKNYWLGELLTGDNSRERPYTVIYPRLTTQSNTFRVHYWVQTLRKLKVNVTGDTAATDAQFFVDPNSTVATNANIQPDQIRGQLRGSFLIERYLQSDDSRSTFAAWCANNYPTPSSNLNSFYKIRILGNTDFNVQ